MRSNILLNLTLVASSLRPGRIRLKGNAWILEAGKGWRQLRAFPLQRGEALCLHTVKLHKQQCYGPVHMALGTNNVNGAFWAIVSDEPTNLQTFREYGLRFQIAALDSHRVEAFLGDQSNGWNLQKSELRSVCALSRLWFILTVAILYVTAQGVAVVASRHRRWVDPHWLRGHCYSRIGWDWVKTALGEGWKLIQSVYFIRAYDPEPAMASRKQHHDRTYRIEFKIRSYQCLPG